MRWQKTLIILIVNIYPLMSRAEVAQVSWAGAYVLTMSKTTPVIDARLSVSLATKTDDDVTPVWVFFTDKGIADKAEYADAISALESKMTFAAYESSTENSRQKRYFRFQRFACGYKLR